MAFEAFPEHPLDEERSADGSIRPVYEATLDALASVDLDDLVTGAADHLAEDGVTFGSAPFVVDPVPRLIEAAEWEPLERGLAQRTRALNAFLLDAYAQRRIVDAGLIAEEVITGAEGYEPDLAGRLPDGTPPAAIIGFDLVRAPDGQFLVLEDNLRTPSGLAYLLAARDALRATLPPGCRSRGRSIRPSTSCWRPRCAAAGAAPGRPGAPGRRRHRRSRQRRLLRARPSRRRARRPARHPR